MTRRRSPVLPSLCTRLPGHPPVQRARRAPAGRGRRSVPGWPHRWLPGIGALLLGVLLAGRPAQAAVRGEMRAWVEEGYARWGPYGVATAWDGPVSHVEGGFYPDNRGVWSGWIDAAPRHQEFRVSAREVPARLGRMSFQAGDTEIDRDAATTLQREFRPGVLLRGAAWSVRRQSFRVEMHAGALTRNQTPFRGGRVSTGSAAGGLSLTGLLAGVGSWEATWDRQDKLPDSPGRQVARLAASTRTERGWARTTELRMSREDGAGWRSSLLAGVDFLNPRLQFAGHLRRIQNGFSELGLYRDPHANEWGGRLQWSFRPGLTSFAGGSIDLSRDLEPRPLTPSREERLVGRVYFTTTFHEKVYLHTTLLYRDRSSIDPDSLLVDQGVSSGDAEIGWKGRDVEAGIGFNRGLFRDEGSSESLWREDRLSAHAVKRFGSHLDTQISSFITDRRIPNGDWKSRETSVEGRVSWSSTNLKHRGWLSVGRDRQAADVRQYERDQWNLGAGWDLGLPAGMSLRTEGFAAIRAGEQEAEAARLTVRLSRHFGFGGGRLDSHESLPEFGSIRGYVREDRNGNGAADADEPGVPGIHLKLGNGTQATTAADGSYVFPRAAAGAASVTLDISTLPARYLAPAEERIALSLAPGEKASRGFALRASASIKGRVIFVGDDGDSLAVAGVLVHIPGTQQDAFTDERGRFELTDLAAGVIIVEVVEWSLPAETRIVNGNRWQVWLDAGAEGTAEPFILVPDRAPVRQVFRPKN